MSVVAGVGATLLGVAAVATVIFAELVVRLVVRLYPRDHERRYELRAEMRRVQDYRPSTQPRVALWLVGVSVAALCDGLPQRLEVGRRRRRHLSPRLQLALELGLAGIVVVGLGVFLATLKERGDAVAFETAATLGLGLYMFLSAFFTYRRRLAEADSGA